MHKIIGLICLVAGIYFLYFEPEERTICTSREDVVVMSLEMAFEATRTSTDAETIKAQMENNPLIQKLESPYANEEDFQAACDAIAEQIKSLN